MTKHLLVKPLCQAFLRREAERGDYGKGKKRDDLAMEFFIGAANVVLLQKGEKSPEYHNLAMWIALVLAMKGYKAIVEGAADVQTIR